MDEEKKEEEEEEGGEGGGENDQTLSLKARGASTATWRKNCKRADVVRTKRFNAGRETKYPVQN